VSARKWLVLAIALVISSVGLYAADKSNVTPLPIQREDVSLHSPESIAQTHALQIVDGSEEYPNVQAIESRSQFPSSLDDTLGLLYYAGTTYYELQHNATEGRTIGVDDAGNVHVVWTNGLDAGFSERKAYYNWLDPTAGGFSFPGGVSISLSPRQGFVSLAVERNGWAFPAFHERSALDPTQHASGGIDSQPGLGTFSITQPAWLNGDPNNQLIWPKIAIGRDSVVHMVSTSSTGSPQAFFYSRGVAQWSGGNGSGITWQNVVTVPQPEQFRLVDSTGSVTPNIAASPSTGRVVIVWSRPARDPQTGSVLSEVNDLYIEVSEDNGLNWGAPTNVTDFCGPDPVCQSYDFEGCNGDTLRAWVDNSVLIDNTNTIHIAFTAVSYHYRDPLGTVVNFTDNPRAGIWYWNSGTDAFSPVALEFGDISLPGGWTTAGSQYRAVCKPSLAIDDATGRLYCSYWRAMPDQWSANMYPMGDIFVSKSSDGGASWSAGRNVTNSNGGQYAIAGTSLSERDPALAERVTTREGIKYLHLLYQLDHEAGSFNFGEGDVTQNEIFYNAIPADSIPASPTVPWSSLHAAPVTGACCYTNEFNQSVCEQKSFCECEALGGQYYGTGSSLCTPANDLCPGPTISSLPFTAEGNTCCANPDYATCGLGKDVFYNINLACTTTVRISLCNSPQSWDSRVAIYRADPNGNCSENYLVGCLDNGCVNPNHVNQIFTFDANVIYIVAVTGSSAEDCGSFVLDIEVEQSLLYPTYPQADTLVVDNGVVAAYYISQVWLRAHFTAPMDFDLRSVYVNTADGLGNCAEQCSVYVYTTAPVPNGEVAAGRSFVEKSTGWGDLKWTDILLDDTVHVPGGSDFWVAVFSPIPGSSWKTILSSANAGRTEAALDGLYGTYDVSAYEAFIRAGGELHLGTPDSLVIRRDDYTHDIRLNWGAVPGADFYNVYRTTTPDVQPLPANLIGTSPINSYVDSNALLLPGENYFYAVTAAQSAALLNAAANPSKSHQFGNGD
jgi:hypothetical protein